MDEVVNRTQMARIAHLLLLALLCCCSITFIGCGGGGSSGGSADQGSGGGSAGSGGGGSAGSGGSGSTGPSPTYTVGGSVSGLSGSLVLQENGGPTVTASMDGTFAFATPLSTGASYQISVLSQPATQQCTVTSGTGTIAATNVENVSVVCALIPRYKVGGTIAGLLGTSVLQNDGIDDLTVSTDGRFSFATALPAGAGYQVTVLSQPAQRQCQVTGGTGTMPAADVVNVVITCSPPPRYTVGGLVSGLSGTVSLSDNGTDGIVVSANGPFMFPTALDSGATYSVTATGQPATQHCTVTSGSGTIAAANVADVNVTCVTLTYTVGGTVSGLSGTLVLQNAGQDNLQIAADGPFTFATPEVSGSTYLVSILTQPAASQCAVRQAAGSIAAANVSSVEILCNPLRQSRYAYVLNPGGLLYEPSSLLQYTIGADGGLVPMVPASLAVSGQPAAIAVDPSGRYVYVATDDSGGSILQYTIGSDGRLTPMTPAAVAIGSSPNAIAVDPAGRYVYVGNGSVASDESISQYAISAGGALVPLSPPTAAATSPPTSIAVAPSGSLAYASAGTIDDPDGVVLQYVVNGDGTLVPADPAEIAVDTGPLQSLSMDAFGRYAYLVEPLLGGIRQYRIDVNGGLIPLGFVLGVTNVPGALAIEPYGKYVYLGSGGSIAQYTVGVDGSLSLMAPATVRAVTPTIFHSVAVDLAGQYAYVTAQVYPGGSVYQYKIGRDGTLTPLATPVVASGDFPGAIAISP